MRACPSGRLKRDAHQGDIPFRRIRFHFPVRAGPDRDVGHGPVDLEVFDTQVDDLAGPAPCLDQHHCVELQFRAPFACCPRRNNNAAFIAQQRDKWTNSLWHIEPHRVCRRPFSLREWIFKGAEAKSDLLPSGARALRLYASPDFSPLRAPAVRTPDPSDPPPLPGPSCRVARRGPLPAGPFAPPVR